MVHKEDTSGGHWTDAIRTNIHVPLEKVVGWNASYINILYAVNILFCINNMDTCKFIDFINR